MNYVCVSIVSHTYCTAITSGDRESDITANSPIEYNYLQLCLHSCLADCVAHWPETKNKNWQKKGGREFLIEGRSRRMRKMNN